MLGSEPLVLRREELMLVRDPVGFCIGRKKQSLEALNIVRKIFMAQRHERRFADLPGPYQGREHTACGSLGSCGPRDTPRVHT